MAKQTVKKKTVKKIKITPKASLVAQKQAQAKAQKRSPNGRFA